MRENQKGSGTRVISRFMQMKRWRQIVSICLAVLLLMSVSGCGREQTEVPEEREQVTLWYYWDQGYLKRELSSMVDEFNQSQEEIEITTQYVPDEDYKKRLALSMADGTMPDLALVDSADFKYYDAMRPFVELTDKIDGLDAYLPQVMECCTVDGKVMGLPYGFNCSVLFFNKDILEQHQAEVPTTWEEFIAVTEKLTDEDHYGFAMPALRSEESTFNLLPLLWSGGGTVDTLDSPESQMAFHLIREMTEKGFMSQQTVNLTGGDLVMQFADGNIAMMMNSSVAVYSVKSQNPELNFDIASIPVRSEGDTPVTVLGGEVFGVADGEHQEAAITFLQFLSEQDRMSEKMKDSAFLAPREDVLEEQMENDAMKEKILEIAGNARLREFSVEWPYISTVLTETMEAQIVGQRDELEILQEAAETVRDIREGEQE